MRLPDASRFGSTRARPRGQTAARTREKRMARQYHGTTVTDFVNTHARLLGTLALLLALALFASSHTATLFGRAVGLFAFCAVTLVWLALLFHALRARPWTALMELLALVLLAGFGAVLVGWVWSWRLLRPVALPVLGYMFLYLVLDETGVSRRPVNDGRDYRLVGVRLLCALSALLLAYLLKT